MIQIELLKQRLAAKEIQLKWDEKVLEYLAEVGFDPVYGARPLKRIIQQRLENPLANEILGVNFGSGDVINVTHGKNGLKFSKK